MIVMKGVEEDEVQVFEDVESNFVFVLSKVCLDTVYATRLGDDLHGERY